MKGWIAAGLTAAGVLWWFPPERYAFYPRCPVYEAFGLLCPGCGATRAAAALLHGRVLEAWHWNALLVAAIPVFIVYGLFGRWRPPAGWMVSCAVGMAILFGVARNLR